MCRLIKYCMACLAAGFFTFECICLNILLFPAHTFDSSYQSTIRDKYDLLMKTNEPKIIFVSGSSGAFGLNAEEVEKATGYRVVNLGLHAGFGFSFISEIAKANINSGDVVLLGYEYYWTEERSFGDIGADLVMSAIDNRISMYRFVPIDQWGSVVGYLFTYAAKKNEYQEVSGVYSRGSFSEDGNQMVIERHESFQPDSTDMHTIQPEISSVSLDYLKKFKKYIENKGASVYFVAAPYARMSMVNPEAMSALVQNEEAELGIPYLSDPEKYGFPNEWMFDTEYHCNSVGEVERTKLLIKDLKKAGVSCNQ